MKRRKASRIAMFGFAFRGIAAAIRQERNMRFHLSAAVVVVAAGLWQRVGLPEWLWLGAAIAGVLTAELINTAVERVVDLVSPGEHPLAQAAKDTAAGAVVVAALFAVFVGLAVLGPPIWRTITG